MTNNIEDHPLTQMIRMYIEQYPDLREENLDLQPIAFHRRYGLSVQAPYKWDILSSVKHVVVDTPMALHPRTVVIFGSTESYHKIYKELGESVRYLSWHEIFTGIHTAATDVRYFQKSKEMLAEANLTFFLDPPAIPEIMDQVRGHTSNCLIVLSGGGV